MSFTDINRELKKFEDNVSDSKSYNELMDMIMNSKEKGLRIGLKTRLNDLNSKKENQPSTTTKDSISGNEDNEARLKRIRLENEEKEKVRKEKAKKSLEQSYENQEKDADFNQNKLVLGSRQDYKEYKLGGKKKLTKRKHSRRKRGGKKTRRNRRSKK